MQSSNFYNIMPDGTVKQVNPFTGTEVWAVPGRGRKPVFSPRGGDVRGEDCLRTA